jgi:hypothetical protein
VGREKKKKKKRKKEKEKLHFTGLATVPPTEYRYDTYMWKSKSRVS